jgi:hypothetical protein
MIIKIIIFKVILDRHSKFKDVISTYFEYENTALLKLKVFLKQKILDPYLNIEF